MKRVAGMLGALLIAGCGGDDNAGKPKRTARAVPDALTGTYTVRLTKADLPAPAKAPPELKPENAPLDWRIEITRTGGPDNGPALNIVNVTNGSLEAPKLSVRGNQLTLSQEECAGATGYTFVNSTYRWVRRGEALRLTKLSGGCPDRVAETILTSRPLIRVP